MLSIPLDSDDPIALELARVLRAPTGVSSAGHPFLQDAAYDRFRDHVPHLLGMGPRALHAIDVVTAAAERSNVDVGAAAKVVRGCVLTAAITAPSDLWLMRHVISGLHKVGLAQRLLEGEHIDPAACDVVVGGTKRTADPRELEADLTFLLSRGYLSVEREHFVAPTGARARHALATLTPTTWPADLSRLWLLAFQGASLTPSERALLLDVGRDLRPRVDPAQDTWTATADEVELGFRLLPIILALRAAGLHKKFLPGCVTDAKALADDGDVGTSALAVLAAAGVVSSAGHVDIRHHEQFAPTATGVRVAEKGAGPMGIIEAYHPYMARLDDILVNGKNAAWVTRGANIAASQDANRESFAKTNDALDAFVADTGFRYGVFIEHAIGRGEATRQRFERALKSGTDQGTQLRYVGADLEDPAIDACIEEQTAGRLPKDMLFVRQADIGDPAHLVNALRAAGVDPEGAVMVIGNGFHEVRNQTDERMIDVFKGYADAGILLLFTEENALRVDDLLTTAWNTYHAGFRYVHEKSGQGLRPAEPAPPSRFGRSLQKSWRECAETAGYVRVEKYSSRSRTVHPLAPVPRTNPSISANHFCVPRRILASLKS
ncbi:MAG: hypothetical protein Q8O67_13890 [Deltaproteobacteria bacterium]|nr:hypothetical protein [Deltaproteobacteria bacterium]